MPEALPAPEQQALLSGVALATFRLHGQVLALAEDLARPAGLTAAWWQVLGAVVHEPETVSGIARTMGITRQSVQRIADLLVERGLAAFEENPAHRRARLLRLTDAGREAIGRITEPHARAAVRLADAMGERELRAALDGLEALSRAFEVIADERSENAGSPAR